MGILNPHPVLLTFGSFHLASHAFFFALGAAVGYLWLLSSVVRKGLPEESVALQAAFIFIFGLLGARVGYFLTYPQQFSSLWQVIQIWNGGLVSYWGMAAGLLTAVAIGRRFPAARRLAWLDSVAIATLLAWSIGRLGNYWAADSVGISSSAWAAFYGRIPIQFFESALCLGLFFALKRADGRWRPGMVLAWAFAGYFAGRSGIDFWREEAFLPIGIRPSQLTSLALGLLSLLYVAYLNRTHEKA